MLRQRTPLKRTRLLRKSKLKPISDKRRLAGAIYSKRRKEFLEGRPRCEGWEDIRLYLVGELRLEEAWDFVGSPPPSTDLHHVCGRSGANYLDRTTWKALCRQSHTWVHEHPKDARAMGLLK